MCIGIATALSPPPARCMWWTEHVWQEEIALASATNAGCACDPMLRVGRASGFCT